MEETEPVADLVNGDLALVVLRSAAAGEGDGGHDATVSEELGGALSDGCGEVAVSQDLGVALWVGSVIQVEGLVSALAEGGLHGHIIFAAVPVLVDSPVNIGELECDACL